MDNDLMARRLRPPSEPAPTSGLPAPPMMPQIESTTVEQDQFFWQAEEAPDPLAPAETSWTPAPQPFAPAPQPFAPPPRLLALATAPPQLAPFASQPQPAQPQPAQPQPAQPDQAQPQPPAFSTPPQPASYPTPPQLAPFAAQPQPAPFAPEPTPAPFAPQGQPAPFAPFAAQPAPFAPQPPPAQPKPAEPFTWPTAREQAPWDRPTDYPEPTDTAEPDQPAWDRPSPTDWIDPEQVDDRTPEMFEAYAERAISKVAAAAAPVAWPPVVSAPAYQPQPSEQPQQHDQPSEQAAPSEPNAADPYDAYAPVLRDVAPPASRPWPETNGHDYGRNAATVAATASASPTVAPYDVAAAEVAAADVAEPPQPRGHDIGPAVADPPWAMAHDVGPAVGSTFTLSQSTETPPAWGTNDPVVTVRVPIPPSGMGERGQGPTPSAELFGNNTVVEARLLPPEPPTALSGPNPPAYEGADEPTPTQAVSLYSTAPPAPLVVRIELSFVDGSKRPVNAAEAARRVGPVEQTLEEPVEGADAETGRFMPRHPAFEPRGQRASEIYDIPTPTPTPAPSPYEAPAARPSPVAPIEAAEPFASGLRPVEPFLWPQSTSVPSAPFSPSPPERATDSDWIEPTAHVEPLSARHGGEHATWADDPVGGIPELASPWVRSAPAVESASAPWVVQGPTAPDASYPAPVHLAPFAAAPQPALVSEPTPTWPQRTYVVDPLAQLPAAAAPAPAWPRPAPQHAAAPAPAAAPAVAPVATPAPPPIAPLAPVAAVAPVAPPAVSPPPSPPRPASYAAPSPLATTPAAPSLSASDRSDLWFLSTEPDIATVDLDHAAETKEPSSLITAALTIGMAVLVIVLVLVFIQLMTSLL